MALGAQPIIAPAFRPKIPRQAIPIAPQVERPALVQRIEHKGAQIEVRVRSAIVAALKGQVQRIRVIPGRAEERQLRAGEAPIQRLPGNIIRAAVGSVPQQIARRGFTRRHPPGHGIGWLPVCARQPEQRWVVANLFFGIGIVEVGVGWADHMQPIRPGIAQACRRAHAQIGAERAAQRRQCHDGVARGIAPVAWAFGPGPIGGVGRQRVRQAHIRLHQNGAG